MKGNTGENKLQFVSWVTFVPFLSHKLMRQVMRIAHILSWRAK
jgi:hypothetical protein